MDHHLISYRQRGGGGLGEREQVEILGWALITPALTRVV